MARILLISNGSKWRMVEAHLRSEIPHVPMSVCKGCGEEFGPAEEFALVAGPDGAPPSGVLPRCHVKMQCLDAAESKGCVIVNPYKERDAQ